MINTVLYNIIIFFYNKGLAIQGHKSNLFSAHDFSKRTSILDIKDEKIFNFQNKKMFI